MKLCFLGKYQPSLMGEPSQWQHYADGWDDLALDLFSAKLVETQDWTEEKIAPGVVHPQTFVISGESPHTQKYNFKVCHRYCKEEKCLACQYEESLKEEAHSILLDPHIRNLAILWRLRHRDKEKGIEYHEGKVHLYQESMEICTAESKNCATQLKERVVVRDMEHSYRQAKYNAADHLIS